MKTLLSPEVHQRVLDLRRSYSLREVAEQTGLPIGTVKTICSRSGAFRDNPEHRALFSLPPIQDSSSTELAVPSLPPQEAVTGDHELDAVLWLRAVIQTGQMALIEKAMPAAGCAYARYNQVVITGNSEVNLMEGCYIAAFIQAY